MTVGTIHLSRIIVQNINLLETIADAVGLDWCLVESVASVAAVNEGFKTLTLTRIGLADFLVLTKSSVHLLHVDVVQEDAGAERSRNRGTKLAITGLLKSASPSYIFHVLAYLQNGLGGLVQDLLVEVGVVQGQTGTAE